MEAFAVDSTTVQLAWGEVGGRGPGTALITGLSPATTYDLRTDGRTVGQMRTLEELPGQELFRLATVNDCHLGERGFGVIFRQRDRGSVEPYPIRCLRAALRAAIDWGAQAIVIKGDLVQRGGPGEWAMARDLIQGVIGDRDIPVFAVPGNHESKLAASTAQNISGIDFDFGPTVRTFPGLTLVTANSSVPGHHRGQVEWADKAVEAAAVTSGPVLIAIHHQLQDRVRYWPPGIVGEAGMDLTRRLGQANPNVWIVSGHTHRNRTYERNGVLLTEVGSTKDYPGTWAGYVVTCRGRAERRRSAQTWWPISCRTRRGTRRNPRPRRFGDGPQTGRDGEAEARSSAPIARVSACRHGA